MEDIYIYADMHTHEIDAHLPECLKLAPSPLQFY